ncbi:UDP-N-acetylmuramoyl-L-alanyl-D-glutamate--2,6-diaminopimelate ligase [Cloacibacillus porcorum]|uniref:UDP-N-acetylmuramoyl-L-alanyl-D-glutamate--2, 6-diaminopimelate ligase n=1 Tax=Cloacibacillus porcorum TaxID=1197717 RepID=UPI0023F53BFD|nr:UDP-N-acetylmuramoyl-L-alanyl-D-glutamate--2,6-diaminopimelate ligase [Cloacibacillus porcorum]MDD7648845.1 UDP-N-acetylmuramoyl-L-alanyl-D-glutamate--2,6-diaminopimelate ligase [Cloacibacillus porcorum]MDY4093915.1 UDP-N-acetylmuramoyl-L-alanyl-D-glutamate--2,6-diaminopimelate ligase [Cloacibacillus porcorum]
MNLCKLILTLEKSHIEHRIHLPEGCAADDIELKGMVCDSRKAGPGMVFAATKGGHRDAHDFIPAAVAAGTPAVLCEHEVDAGIPQIICLNVRSAMGEVASLLYEEPSKKMTMIALTGTNGKTTSTFMTQAILNHAGIKTGLMGTVLYDDGEKIEEAEHTTPEGCDIQNILARMIDNGCKACVMEASSHAIVQGRIDGLRYDRAGFTNLTLEHLDFHKDMEHYFLAKKSLFDSYMRNNWKASINIDDQYGRRLCEELGKRVISYSMIDEEADFFASVANITLEGLEIEIKTPESPEKKKIKLPILGAYNVLNALQALSLAWSIGVSAQSALEALEKMPQVPGRLERYRFDNGASCVIDFAHSSDGLEKVLSAVRPICRRKLYVVFGAGGDRDTSKRPVMGEIASRLGDFVVVTSDNPRSEDPASIMAAIEPGVKEHDTPYTMIADRRQAIYYGLDQAGADDIVVIAGRGPETHQILKDGPIPLVDKEIMEDWCRLSGKRVI